MAGSHRNDDQLRHRILAYLPHIAIAVGVVAIVAFVWWTATGDPEEPSTENPPAAATSAPPTPKATQTTEPEPELTEVAESAPKRLTIEGVVSARFDQSIELEDGQLESRSGTNLSRVGSRGEPGSPGTDTVVVVGQDRFDRQAALNDIADVARGDEIVLQTANGRLTYTVENTYSMASDNIPEASAIADKEPGRLVLIATTYSERGNRTGADTVVVAQLSDATTG